MTNENSCLCGVEIPPEIGEIRENEFNVLDSDKFIRFYTAQAFKGLEAQVVIYLDIEGFKSNDERMLNGIHNDIKNSFNNYSEIYEDVKSILEKFVQSKSKVAKRESV